MCKKSDRQQHADLATRPRWGNKLIKIGETMRMNTQFITRALLVVALLSIFGMAMAVNVDNILDLWNIRTSAATLSGNYTQTADIDLSVTKLDYLPNWEANKTYVVGDVVKHPSDGFAYWCNTINSDASFVATNWTKMWESSKGWEPIGNATTPFKGIYDGNNKTISNLYINRGSTSTVGGVYDTALNTTTITDGTDNVGLFGYVSNAASADATIKNLGIIDPNVTGKRGTGALVGKVMIPSKANKKVYVTNCYATGGTVKGFGATGGLVGANNSDRKQQVPVIRYCHASVTVSSTHPLNNSINTGDNNNPYNIKYGGLVGCNENGITEDSYARGTVSGGDRVGGLAGCTIGGAIIRSYSTGNVTQNISSKDWQGGFGRLVGLTLGRLPPGLGGTNAVGSCEDCYYLSSSTATPALSATPNTAGTALYEDQMKDYTYFANWDFFNVWDGATSSESVYPYLRSSSAPVDPATLYDYQSSPTTDNNGTWATASDWQIYNNKESKWDTATNYPTAYNSLSIKVLNSHTMTVNANVTIDQTTVNSGGKIVVSVDKTLTVRDGEGNDLVVAGDLEHSGTLTLEGSSYSLVSGTLNSNN